MAISRVGKNAYGVAIQQEIEDCTGRSVSAGALYTTLARLEAKDYVSSWLGDPILKRGGRAKRFFQMEPLGEKALNESERIRRKMREGVKLISADVLDRKEIFDAYNRACWLLTDAHRAKAVVNRAAAKVWETSTSMEENRQRAHRYRGNEQRPGYRAYLNRHQIFNLLVMNELNTEEIHQEREGPGLTEADWIKRFVKHSIQVSLTHNSYWAAVWMCRILCNYSTSEMERFYQVIAPNRAVTKGEVECSKVRKLFLERIAARFNVRSEDALDGQTSKVLSPSDWRVTLIQECLFRFLPSYSDFVVPEDYEWRLSEPPLLAYDENDPHGDQSIEIDRMCILFTPVMFNRIAKSLNLRPFESSVRSLNFWKVSPTGSAPEPCHEQ